MAVGNCETGGAVLGALDSQSYSGGGLVGALDSQCFVGNAKVSGLSIVVPGTTTAGGLQFGFFFKMAYTANYNTGIVLFQLGLASAGYIMVGLQNNASIWYGLVASGGSGVWSNTQNPAWFITPQTWYYVTYALGTSGGTMVQRIYIHQAGVGWVDGTALNCGTALSGDTTLTATLGLGCNVTTSNTFAGWQPFPKFPGSGISKVWLRNANPTGTAQGGPTGANALAMPRSDAGISGLTPAAYYLCREAPGALATLTDGSANHFDATAGGGGLQILTDGPYA